MHHCSSLCLSGFSLLENPDSPLAKGVSDEAFTRTLQTAGVVCLPSEVRYSPPFAVRESPTVLIYADTDGQRGTRMNRRRDYRHISTFACPCFFTSITLNLSFQNEGEQLCAFVAVGDPETDPVSTESEGMML